MAQKNRMKHQTTMNASDIQVWGDSVMVRLKKYATDHPPTYRYIEEFSLPPEPEEIYLTENELEDLLREPIKPTEQPF